MSPALINRAIGAIAEGSIRPSWIRPSSAFNRSLVSGVPYGISSRAT